MLDQVQQQRRQWQASMQEMLETRKEMNEQLEQMQQTQKEMHEAIRALNGQMHVVKEQMDYWCARGWLERGTS